MNVMVFGENNIKNIDLILSNNCNLNCLFCNSDKWILYKWNLKKVCSIINHYYKKWFSSITFSWWEPTLDENLFLYIAFAKKLWFKEIKIQTNLMFSEEYFLKLLKYWITELWFTYLWLDKTTFISITWNVWKFTLYSEMLNFISNYINEIDINIDIVLNDHIIDNIWDNTEKLLSLWFKNFNYKFPFFTWKKRLEYDLKEYSDKLKEYLIWKNFNFFILYIPTCYLKWLEKNIYNFKNDFIYDFKYNFSLEESILNLYEKFDECNKCEYKGSCFWFEKGNLNKFKPLI